MVEENDHRMRLRTGFCNIMASSYVFIEQLLTENTMPVVSHYPHRPTQTHCYFCFPDKNMQFKGQRFEDIA
jgi:hypothetical protein